MPFLASGIIEVDQARTTTLNLYSGGHGLHIVHLYLPTLKNVIDTGKSQTSSIQSQQRILADILRKLYEQMFRPIFWGPCLKMGFF